MISHLPAKGAKVHRMKTLGRELPSTLAPRYTDMCTHTQISHTQLKRIGFPYWTIKQQGFPPALLPTQDNYTEKLLPKDLLLFSLPLFWETPLCVLAGPWIYLAFSL